MRSPDPATTAQTQTNSVSPHSMAKARINHSGARVRAGPAAGLARSLACAKDTASPGAEGCTATVAIAGVAGEPGISGRPDLERCGIALGVLLMELLEPITHLLGYERANRAHPSVGLQGRAADIEGDVGRIDDAPQGQ